MELTAAEKLRLLAKNARRVTTEEVVEGNLRVFERLGLSIDDIHIMAKSVGLEAEDLLLLDTNCVGSIRRPQFIKGKPGRRKTHHDIAEFAAVRRERGMTWKEIYLEWKRTYPSDTRAQLPEDIREAYRRGFGDKSRKGY